ncbi:MAG: 4Fe-4S dicluster domain-containing protein [Candidatus Heimdallarchaeota archaeon]|nr:4Fe-4S dicluster domain-containing protein [Candidatus Heimdallarchaeota archaeon]
MAQLEVIFQNESNKTLVLLGNEAIARGIIESGVSGVFTYPGTPSSEIPTTLYEAQDFLKSIGYKLYLEWSTNEAVALEAAFGFSFSGQRTIFISKHVGLNVAADAFMTLVNAGVKGGLVLIIAEDPHMHSSQNEQDNRWYTKLANVPMFEPSSAQEAKDMLKSAFELSEKFETPVILRTVTRIAHSRADIVLDSIKFPEWEKDISLEIDPRRFVCVPRNARMNKQRILNLTKRISEELESTKWNVMETGDQVNHIFITCGSAYNYLKEFLNLVGLNPPILKIGISHPFPNKKIKEYLESYPHSDLIIVEEADDILETFVKKLAFEVKFKGDIFGRREGVTPSYGELTTYKVWEGLMKVYPGIPPLPIIPNDRLELLINRPPVLCPGCPHRATFYALNKAVSKKKRVVSTDIGCYTLGAAPPLNTGHVVICMGSSVGIGSGLAHIEGNKEPIIAIIGDSTFWHTGLPGLVNAVYNKSKLLLLAVDNSATAMTGFQPNPGEILSIEAAAKGVGVKYVATIDAFKPKESIPIIKEAITHEDVSVIVSKGECRIQYVRREGLPTTTFFVESERCVGCHTCVRLIACPAIMWSGMINSKGKEIPVIDQSLCARCGLCAEVCPYGVIVSKEIENALGD